MQSQWSWPKSADSALRYRCVDTVAHQAHELAVSTRRQPTMPSPATKDAVRLEVEAT